MVRVWYLVGPLFGLEVVGGGEFRLRLFFHSFWAVGVCDVAEPALGQTGTLRAGVSLASLRISAPRLRTNSLSVDEAGMLMMESGYATWPLKSTPWYWARASGTAYR